MNQLASENADLRQAVTQLRYGKHSQSDGTEKSGLKNSVNQLATENADLKQVIGVMRYGTPLPGKLPISVLVEVGIYSVTFPVEYTLGWVKGLFSRA